MHPKPPCDKTILVTDAGRGSAIAILRSLGRRGWRVIAADCHRHSLGFRSRYAHETFVYPSPLTAPTQTVAALRRAARDRGVDLIIPVTDELILPLSEARRQFDGLCKLALPAAEGLEVTIDKQKTLELARRLRVPVPRTRLVTTVSEAGRYGPPLGWPLVLKPQTSRVYRDRQAVEAYAVCYARSGDHLATQMQRFEGHCPVLLQEYTGGVGYGVELLMHEGRPLAAFQHRRIREIPVNGGASSMRESVPLDPALYRHSLRLLGELRWTGLAMVEYKIGPQGPKLMEINGRVWGSLPLAVFCGMDFPARLAELGLFGESAFESPPHTSYRIGVRTRSLELDLIWIASVLLGRQRVPFLPMPKRRAALAAVAELFNPACKFDIMSLEDPRPGLAEIFKIVRKFARKWKTSS